MSIADHAKIQPGHPALINGVTAETQTYRELDERSNRPICFMRTDSGAERPLGYSLIVQRVGGTVLMMPRFDTLEALRLIEQYGVTHSQWVPKMFVRMLKLPQAEREQIDLSSHRIAIHAAASCPVNVKREMIEWWGPIMHEYYGATESIGVTQLDSDEWLALPGSVGKATLGILHICDEAGVELPTGEIGLICFERETMTF